MASAHHTCPDCGYLDVEIQTEGIYGANGVSLDDAKCPNCNWSGKSSDTVGFATTEQVWDIEKIGAVMLRVAAKHAAGPLFQVVEWAGLLPRMMEEVPKEGDWTKEKVEEHNEVVQEMRDTVMRSVLQNLVTSVFEAAEAANRAHAVHFDSPMHPMLRGQEKPSAD